MGINVPAGSLGAMVRTYKSTVTRFANRVLRKPGAPVWQRGYWERIIRDERHLDATRRYIANNPRRWVEDRDNLDDLLARMNSRD
jgi:putative transposase